MGKKIVALLTILAIIFTVAIFTPDSNAGIQTLNLSKQEKSIKVGESFQLTMTGVKASSIKWKSSKPGVATVSKKGVVKGIKAGTTNITGKYKSLKFTVKVTITNTKSSDSNQSTTVKGKELIFSDDSCEFYFDGTEIKYDKLIVNFKVINKLNENANFAFDMIYADGEKQYDKCCDGAMPNMECNFYFAMPKGSKPKQLKGVLYAFSDKTGYTIYSKEFTYTIKY